jgi:hypothetical protein
MLSLHSWPSLLYTHTHMHTHTYTDIGHTRIQTTQDDSITLRYRRFQIRQGWSLLAELLLLLLASCVLYTDALQCVLRGPSIVSREAFFGWENRTIEHAWMPRYLIPQQQHVMIAVQQHSWRTFKHLLTCIHV